MSVTNVTDSGHDGSATRSVCVSEVTDRGRPGRQHGYGERGETRAIGRTGQEGSEAGEGPARRLTIVVADDSPAVLALMAEVLRHSADTLITARDGAGAWQAIRAHRPRVAILDDQMPGLTGMEVAALVRADPALAETRLVLVTGEASAEAEAEADAGEGDGIQRLVPKSFRPHELVAVVRELAA